MLIHPGNHVGDAWFHVCGEVVHAFYLTAPSSVKRYTLWDIGHATSRNLVDWKIEGIAIPRGRAGERDERGLATGSVFAAQGRFFMSYTISEWAETVMAVSDDLFRWSKCGGEAGTKLDPALYEPIGTGKRASRHWRDPFVIRHEGSWYQLTCASDPTAPEGIRGTVGLARSGDLQSWTILPPLDVEPVCQEMECPQLYWRNERWYLVFSALADQISEEAKARIGAGNVWWTTYVMMAKDFFGPYRLAAHPRIVPASQPVQPYACQIVSHRGQDFCLGSVWPEGGGDHISDPLPVRFTESGIEPVG